MDFLKTLGASLLAWIIGFGILIVGSIVILVGAVVSMIPEDKITTNSESPIPYLDDARVGPPTGGSQWIEDV